MRRWWALAVAGALSISIFPAARAADQTRTARSVSTIQRWSDPATWGGRLPGRDESVRIPSGTEVLLDISPPPLGGFSVDGTLRFAKKSLSLTADWIMVHGSLQVGSSGEPFRKRAVITLTGDDRATDVMGMGNRFLGVMGGELDLHGRRIPGWTRLGATASKGATAVTLAKQMPWKPGDRIAIASSSYWARHDEERTITHVDGARIELDRPLDRMHFGELQSFAGRTMDERAEVALLSRNVVIRSSDDAGEDGFGGHMMFMEGAEARLDGVELDRMGQRGLLRRYPVHFHMDGSATDSYLRRSSIHHSFNRCVTIHGTSDLKLKGNVCFEHLGHGFFLEDGAETGNVLVNNLGFGTRDVKDGLLPSDRRAATYWITNPDNELIGNVAAGSESIGFWYALPEHPTGLSGSTDVWPRRIPLGSFRGNVAHSNEDTGLNVDHGPRPDGTTQATWYRPVSDPSDPDSTPVPAVFEDFTAYFNRDRGVWLRGENHEVRRAMLADNRAGATFASEESFLTDSVVVGESANRGTVESWEETGPGGRALPFFWEPEAQVIGFEFYDGRVGTTDSTFVNFQTNPVRPAGALGYLAPNAFGISPQNFASGVSFQDSNPVYLADPAPGMDGDASKVFVDRDGTVTGTAGRTVVVDNPFLVTDGCRFEAGWNSHVCPSRYVSVMVGGPSPDAVKPVTLTRTDEVSQTLMGCCDDSEEAWTSAFPNQRYKVGFNGGTPKQARFVLWRGKGDHVDLVMPVGSAYAVTRWGRALKAASSLSVLSSTSDSTYFHDRDTGLLYLRVFGNGTWEEVRISQI